MTRQNSLFQRPQNTNRAMALSHSCAISPVPDGASLHLTAWGNVQVVRLASPTRPVDHTPSSAQAFKSIAPIQLGTDRRVLPNTRRQLIALALLILTDRRPSNLAAVRGCRIVRSTLVGPT